MASKTQRRLAIAAAVAVAGGAAVLYALWRRHRLPQSSRATQFVTFRSLPTRTSFDATRPLNSTLAAKYAISIALIPSRHEFDSSPIARSAFDALVASLRDVPVLGIDAEWCKDRPTSLLQLSSHTHCVILQLMGFDVLPPAVRDLLENEGIVKCGVGIRGDATRFRREFGVELTQRCELGHLAAVLKAVPPKARSLAAVTLALTGDALGKDISVTMSNWEDPNLTDTQISYAADDAICAVASALELFARFGHSLNDDEREQDQITLSRDNDRICSMMDRQLPWVRKAFESHELRDQFMTFYLKHKPNINHHPTDGADACGGGKSQPLQQLSAEEKRLMKIANREQRQKNRKPGDTASAPAAAAASDASVSAEGPSSTSSAWAVSGTVRVLSCTGVHIFNVDVGKARWYVEKKQLAVVTKRRDGAAVGNANFAGRDVAEIQLNFEPKVKTKLCMNWQLGSCPVGEACPFAHGVGDFAQPPEGSAASPAAEGAAMQHHSSQGEGNDDEAHRGDETAFEVPYSAMMPEGPGRPPRPMCCAICLGAGALLKHCIVPPAFRRYLPPPFNTGVAEDYLAVCLTCNPRVRLTYDIERKRLEDAMAADSTFPPIFDVAKTIRYCQILTSGTEDYKKIPAARLEEMRGFVANHLHTFYPAARDASFVLTDSVIVEVAAMKVADVHNAHIVAHAVGDNPDKAIELIRRYRELFVTHFRPVIVPWQGQYGAGESAS